MVLRGRALVHGISALIKRGLKELICPLYHMRTQPEGRSQKMFMKHAFLRH
jgi:hypothetical protein